ncbi:hypothetical protein BE04_21125 [Sorangium cellulosum]|uniref:Uncharacterized protein n=1 Tax=Sorangium cellulosum TaxID=56 RepID=A0A150Q3Z5_SORCE|nr:hypothetical protein BE04_21125 [Sorangium cellulosum]
MHLQEHAADRRPLRSGRCGAPWSTDIPARAHGVLLDVRSLDGERRITEKLPSVSRTIASTSESDMSP